MPPLIFEGALGDVLRVNALLRHRFILTVPLAVSQPRDMKHLFTLTKVLVVLFYSCLTSAEVLFEGYYKLTLGTEHIGYIIQRYELESASKTFSSVNFVLTKTAEATTSESLSAKANTKLEPLSYQYTRLEGTKSKAIDAIVKKNKLVLKIVENGKAQPREVGINNKVFFSTFLAHLMLKNPNGISVGNKFSYEAIAEEDGTVEKGEVFVKEQVKEKGLQTFRTLNTFKKEQFVNWVNIKGESIKTEVPGLNLRAELMADPKQAYGTLPFNQSTIQLLFGKIPEGKINMLSKQ